MFARFYRYLKWLSLDVTAGAIVLSAFFSSQLGLPIHVFELIALGTAIWLIYNIDHLVDARKVLSSLGTRRNFHRQYARFILWFSVFVCIGGIYTAFRLPWEVVRVGLFLTGLSIGYLVLAGKLFWLKEFLVAVIYSTGVLIPILVRIDFRTEVVLIWIALFLLAFANLLIISKVEYLADRSDGFQSIVTEIGLKVVRPLFYSTLILASGIGLLLVGTNWMAGIYFPLVCILYGFIWHLRIFHQKEVYRTLADGAFILPVLFL